MAEIQWRTALDNETGVTRIMGSLRIDDGREVAAYEEVHGRYRAMLAPYVYQWAEYPEYQDLIDMAKHKIEDFIQRRVAQETNP